MKWTDQSLSSLQHIADNQSQCVPSHPAFQISQIQSRNIFLHSVRILQQRLGIKGVRQLTANKVLFKMLNAVTL